MLVGWTSFLVAIVLLAVVPGPTTALVIRRTATHGTRAALPVIAGNECGIYAWALASAFGVAALVAASAIADDVLRGVGAVVLVGLGIQAWRSSRRVPGPSRVPARRGVLAGLVTNLANPKAAVFAFAFYPQFVPPGAPVVETIALLGAVQVVVDGTYYLLVAALVGRARDLFARSAVRRWLERLSAAVLVGLGVRLAVESQR